MNKVKSKFLCIECKHIVSKWVGQCPACGSWNSLKEVNGCENLNFKKNIVISSIKDVSVEFEKRYVVGMDELDLLFGGGIVKGSISLIGGSPGIGKSTLLLQICKQLRDCSKIFYISAEESVKQIKIRSDRLSINNDNIFVMSECNMQTICDVMLKERPEFVVIDSIQTVSLNDIASVAGSVVQVRECAYMLQRIAKQENITIILVSHVNKEGRIAGPKVLEHIVDTVLYFEGDFKSSFRMLRVVKNRFGSVDEIGIFDMKSTGLVPVLNPFANLLNERPKKASGSCICSVMEGKRPIFAEVQSLVAKSSFGLPRRMCKGLDYNKLILILAVLEKRVGFFFQNLDCYVSVVGGLKLQGTGFDLAVALSLIASLKNVEIDENVLVLGEIGLAGEVRGIYSVENTVLQAQKLGFSKVILPQSCFKNLKNIDVKVELFPVDSVRSAVDIILGSLKKGEI